MELRSPGPSLDYQDNFCTMKPRLPIQAYHVPGLEKAHGVCDLQISSLCSVL